MSHGKPQALTTAKTPNYVHKDTIHGETIRKEMRYLDKNRSKHFQLNPHNGIISYSGILPNVILNSLHPSRQAN